MAYSTGNQHIHIYIYICMHKCNYTYIYICIFTHIIRPRRHRGSIDRGPQNKPKYNLILTIKTTKMGTLTFGKPPTELHSPNHELNLLAHTHQGRCPPLDRLHVSVACIICYTILCHAMLCYAILHLIMLYYSVLYHTILYYTILHYTVLC